MTRKNGSRHGLHAVMARVKLRGLAAIDTRTVAARSLLAWKRELLESLGGEAKLSPQKRSLVDGAAILRLYVAHLDAWLLSQPSLVEKRTRRVIRVVEQRQQLWNDYERTLGRLGLDRVGPEPPSLAEYFAQRERAQADGAGRPEANTQANNGQDDSEREG